MDPLRSTKITKAKEPAMKRRNSFRRSLGMLMLLAAIPLPSGCQFAPKKTPAGWSWTEEEKPVVPERILAIWTDTVLRQPNQPGVRGFGGRVFFYDKEQNDPIEVDGKLVVFVFDADDHNPENQKPLRKYVIDADDFAKHMSKTSIGPAYSVWLPWGDVKGPTKKLSIIARYEGRHGGTTLSDPTMKLLPGVEARTPKTAIPHGGSPSDKPLVLNAAQNPMPQASQVSPGVQRASYIQAPNAIAPDLMRATETNRRTETIEVPPSFQRHFQPSDATGRNGANALGTNALEPQITRSQVTTEVIDARSQKLGTFKKAFSESSGLSSSGAVSSGASRPMNKSMTSRLEVLRSGKSISKKTADSASEAESEALSELSNANP
jgi:hypothetical protein